ncbi:MAG TPA: chemotaxis protein CheB [Bryobacteraceae bacterium]|nr:chemotaxis protein CheB [Bryobacteraceae bacterium]
MADEKPSPASERSQQATPANDLMVVGVGASAGGLEAFSELLRYLPPSTGMAFVLVQHLDPHHESALPELLAGKTQMRVVQVQHETPLQPDHVYVIAPNTQMRVRNRTLILESRPNTIDTFKPIDLFFNSLGEEFHFNAIGVVLSGTASDGTLGLKTIKAEGGITFAQNQTAKFDSMPRSAIAAGAVDFVLPPRRIAEELVAIASRTAHLTGPQTAAQGDGSSMHAMLLLLRNATGVDFTLYKQPTVLRRLNRRMVLRKVENVEQYVELLQKEADEVKALFDDLLINVTDFFRDPEVFEAAKRVAFPGLLKETKGPRVIRAWIPGCSTGEEVYSIAIALVEFLEAEDVDCRIQMFGTDVSDNTIDRARTGIFSESAVANVSPERLRRFFVRTDSGYQISRTIREMCIFSRHNVANDPPLSRMDLISCRNLLIYFSPSLQRRIIATFGYALQPQGCLILGSSETLGSLSDFFQAVDEAHKIYCKKANISQNVFQTPETGSDYVPAVMSTPVPHRAMAASSMARPLRQGFAPDLSHYGPVGIVVNEALQITQYRGDVDDFLAAPELDMDRDLMTVLRQDLRAPVSTAIEQARRTELPVVTDSITAVAGGERSNTISITVVPLSLSGLPLHFLLLLGRAGEGSGTRESASDASTKESAAPISVEEENSHLKQELKSTREYLQSVIEELRSSNEEAQSANEELQSTNEEMQTSKEELQSSNEELNTINMEMQSRNTELKQINDDLTNLLGSMNVPIVMTGSDLRIRRFTPIAEKALRLISTDVGRPIADLKPRINVPNLEEILQQVLDTLQPYEQEVQDQEGRSYLMRVRPYRTNDNRIDGTVLQLLDVTDLKRSLEDVKHARDYAEMIVNTVREPLSVLDENLFIKNANQAFYNAVDLPPNSVLGKTIFEISRARFDVPPVRDLFKSLKQGAAEISDVEVEYHERGYSQTLLVNASRLRTSDSTQLILLAFEDITERKRASEARYRRLFENARDGIILVDSTTGEIIDLNPFADRLMGYRRDQVVARKLWEIEAMQAVPTIRASLEQIRDQGVLRFDDLTLRTKDGREVQVEAIASVYFEGDRRAIQFNIRDITERKKFEHQLQETQKLESLGLLAGGIAHDFSNLLTAILGNASLAFSQTAANDPIRMRLRQIVDASERAAGLTRQMLAYAGKGQFVVSALDLGEFMQELAEVIRTTVPKNIDLRFDLAHNLPPIEADSAQIQQMIMNLVINAAESIGEDSSGRITVRTSLREITDKDAADFFQGDQSAPGTYVQLEVADTGRGMDDATRARIFDPSFTTKPAGRGLGLPAVQGIVRGHRGAIRVYSTPGQGSTFLILLPASVRDRAIAAPAQAGAQTIPAGTVALVIEQEPAVRELAEHVLSGAGMKVLVAANGEEVPGLLREHGREVSVVVLDVQTEVPAVDSQLRTLRQIHPNVPLILLTGMDGSEAERRFAAFQPVRFLRKPYTAMRLIHAVAEALTPKD